LVLGDYFKSGADFLRYTTLADELITWLRSKTYVLGLLRNIQTELSQGTRKILSVIRAVLTRWTSHFLAYRRLLELQRFLIILVDKDAALPTSSIITGNAAARNKARSMIALIRNGLFWHSLLMLKRHLEPFALCVTITQAATARLDTIILTFAIIYLTFDQMTLDEEQPARDAVCSSVNMRWLNSDQDVFIAAVILNPLYRGRPFRKESIHFNVGNIHLLMCRLYKRFFHRDPLGTSLWSEVQSYLTAKNNYTNIDIFVKMESDISVQEVSRTISTNFTIQIAAHLTFTIVLLEATQ
ncbi:hypothetical protein K474DRAFT_1599424, partial [Panus rudis PR-1116 ss-1]